MNIEDGKTGDKWWFKGEVQTLYANLLRGVIPNTASGN